jgi:cold shock CspA family protein
MESIVTGSLTYWNAEKKFGFIDPDREFRVAKSIFLHFSALKDPSKVSELHEGARLSFTTAANPSAKRPLKAVEVEFLVVKS